MMSSRPATGGFFVEQMMSETPETQAVPAPEAQAASNPETIQAADESRELSPEPALPAEGTEEKPEPKADEPEAEAEENADPDDDEGDKPKKSRSGLTRLRQRAEAAEAELARLKLVQAIPNEDAIKAAVVKEIGPEPKEEDFNGDWVRYNAALAAYMADQRVVERTLKRQVAEAQTQTQQRRADLMGSFAEQAEKASKTISDFGDALASLTKAGGFASPHIEEAILTSEKGALLAYHLAKNPSELRNLQAMSPIEAARRVGVIEAKISTPVPKVTAAPKPIKPIGGGAQSQTFEDLPMEAFQAALLKRMAR